MDPASIVGLIGSVTRLAGAAYTSSKALYEFINTVRHAHEDFEELATQLLILDGVLSSLQTSLEGRGHGLKEKQVSCLFEAKLTIEKCKESCDAFKTELQKIMSNSQDGKKSLRDGIKRHFKGKTITDFRVLVESYKSSLSLVLHTVCFESISENTKVVEAFGQELQLAKDNIGVQLKDVKSRLDTLLESTSISDDDNIEAGARVAIEAYKNRLQKPLQLQQAQLAQCMKLVSTSIEGVQQAAQGHSYKNIETGERVRQVIGNVGKVSKDSGTHSYEGIKSTGDVRQILGNTDTEGFAMLMGLKPGEGLLDDS